MESNKEAKAAFLLATNNYLKAECKNGTDKCTSEFRVKSPSAKKDYWEAICKKRRSTCKSYAESVCHPKTPDCTKWVERATRENGLGHRTKFLGTKREKSELTYAEIGCITGGTTIVLLLACIGMYACKTKDGKNEDSSELE